VDEKQKNISIGGEYVIPNGQTVEQAVDIVIENLKIMIELGHNFQVTVSTYSQKVELSNNRIYTAQSSAAIVYSEIPPNSQKIIDILNASQSIPGILCLVLIY
jgi:hypothetical protein